MLYYCTAVFTVVHRIVIHGVKISLRIAMIRCIYVFQGDFYESTNQRKAHLRQMQGNQEKRNYPHHL